MSRYKFALALICVFGLNGIGTAIAADKCATPKGRCALEAGGQCNPATGYWCIGMHNHQMCGGTIAAFTWCLDRARGTH